VLHCAHQHELRLTAVERHQLDLLQGILDAQVLNLGALPIRRQTKQSSLLCNEQSIGQESEQGLLLQQFLEVGIFNLSAGVGKVDSGSRHLKN
jgi:hypothetical protein